MALTALQGIEKQFSVLHTVAGDLGADRNKDVTQTGMDQRWHWAKTLRTNINQSREIRLSPTRVVNVCHRGIQNLFD